MSSFTAEVRQEIAAVQEIPGGTCPLAPIQVCIIWAARQEKAISPLAFKVYFAAHEIKYWRCKGEPAEPYHYEPYGFLPADITRLLPGVDAAKIARAFGELEAINILKFTDRGISFAEHLDEVTVNEHVKHRTLAVFNQLHQDTREKLVKFPRRLLKLIVQCGRRMVRAATLIGMLLTTMLTKRTEQYEGYQGCVKANWIANVFHVNAKRVNLERAKLIAEGWFRRLPTPQRVRNQWGEWVALNLGPAKPPEPAGNPSLSQSKVQPPQPQNPSKVQPPSKKPASPPDLDTNQKLARGEPPGGQQPESQKPADWRNIILYDLKDHTRSEGLRQQAIERNLLRDTEADRVNFFAAVAHALRVAKHNPCGLLRTLIEKQLWHVISQADEDKGIRHLRQVTEAQPPIAVAANSQSFPIASTTSREVPLEASSTPLSKDAFAVEHLTTHLTRVGCVGDLFQLIKRHDFLKDWTRERWNQARDELEQYRHQVPPAPTSIGSLIDATDP